MVSLQSARWGQRSEPEGRSHPPLTAARPISHPAPGSSLGTHRIAHGRHCCRPQRLSEAPVGGPPPPPSRAPGPRLSPGRSCRARAPGSPAKPTAPTRGSPAALTRQFGVLLVLPLLGRGRLLLHQHFVHLHAGWCGVLRFQVVHLSLQAVHPRRRALRLGPQRLALLLRRLQHAQHLVLEVPQLRGVAAALIVPLRDPLLLRPRGHGGLCRAPRARSPVPSRPVPPRSRIAPLPPPGRTSSSANRRSTYSMNCCCCARGAAARSGRRSRQRQGPMAAGECGRAEAAQRSGMLAALIESRWKEGREAAPGALTPAAPQHPGLPPAARSTDPPRDGESPGIEYRKLTLFIDALQLFYIFTILCRKYLKYKLLCKTKDKH